MLLKALKVEIETFLPFTLSVKFKLKLALKQLKAAQQISPQILFELF